MCKCVWIASDAWSIYIAQSGRTHSDLVFIPQHFVFFLSAESEMMGHERTGLQMSQRAGHGRRG